MTWRSFAQALIQWNFGSITLFNQRHFCLKDSSVWYSTGKISTGATLVQVSPQGSVLGPLFLLVYINDLVDNTSSDAKLFADDTSLFAVVYDEETYATVLNNDLNLIKQWAFQWKMQFNLDVNKQAG